MDVLALLSLCHLLSDMGIFDAYISSHMFAYDTMRRKNSFEALNSTSKRSVRKWKIGQMKAN